ncbi:uracil-xanthine permease family protein [Clostridium sp.]|jgi:uracil permease|uniref:uracil-xanthine permease family protein n=1 Tax=Clostridium sp. TaxID=1506 RepID=UPI0025BD43DD|nr:solute carrier family 23 protein [Clostridium sp.]MCI9069834.1 purine/pyrimidine permease [Clostridium sp.]
MTQFTGSISSKNEAEKGVKASLFKLVLALQHLIAMFGATVLVPILTGLDPSVALFSAGIGTLIFHLCTKGKVPVFLGSSFAFIPVILAVSEKYGDLRYAQGGIIVVGAIYVLVSLIIKKIGLNNIKKILPAQVVGPMIIVIGVNLIPSALEMTGVIELISGNKSALIGVVISAITLGIALLIKKFSKGFLSQVSILISVFIGYIISLILGQVSVLEIQNASLIAIPSFTLPKFDTGAIAIIAPVVLAVFMEHIGDITTNGEVVGQNFVEDPGLNRTLLGDGLATLAAGFIGGPANTTYGENTGVLAITKNYNPGILRITAIFAIILSFIDKFGAIIRTIPQPVMGGISLILFSMIAIVGVKTIKREKVKFSLFNMIVMISILFIGLSGNFLSSPISIKITESVSISGLSLAALVGVLLNVIFTQLNKTIKNKF